jgi:DNA mismatch repair protein MutL
MIDKHAAHERILFNKLKENRKVEVQSLLASVPVSLAKEEYDAVINNISLLEEAGFEIEDFGNSTVMVRAVPSFLTKEDISSLVSEIAANLITNGTVSTDKEDDLYHTVACKAAIKAGSKTTPTEMLKLAETVLSSKDIMYCPHGRPVAFEIKKYELEKQFGRIQ